MSPEQRDQQIERWFAQHKATRKIFTADDGSVIEQIYWSAPGTGNGATVYSLMHRSILTVTGDIGDWIFNWYSPANFEVLSKYAGSPHYFMEKCLASNKVHYGRIGYEWDPAAAYKSMMRVFEEQVIEKHNQDPDEDAQPWEGLAEDTRAMLIQIYIEDQFGESITSSSACFYSARDLVEALSQTLAFQDTADEYSYAGSVISFHAHAMMKGLQMAVAQLSANQSPTEEGPQP